MAKTPEERALTDVEKAVRDHEKAREKEQKAEQAFADAANARVRTTRVLKYTSAHPDLPEDFDLDAFTAEILKPFEEAPEDPIETDAEAEAGQLAEAELQAAERSDVTEPKKINGAKVTKAEPVAEDDNPFGD